MRDFGNVGASMQGALEQFLKEQEVRRRTEMLDQVTINREKRLAENMVAQTKNTEANTQSMIDQRDANIAAKEIDTFTGSHAMGDKLSPEDAANKKFAAFVQPGQATQGAHLGTDESGVDQYEVSTSDPTFKGTPEQRQKAGQKDAVRSVIQRNSELANHPGIKTALEMAEATGEYSGLYSALSQMTRAQEPEVRSAGGDLFERQPDGQWKKVASGATSESNKNPYYHMMQTANGVQMVNSTNPADVHRIGDLKPGEGAQDDIQRAQSVGYQLQEAKNLFDPAWVGPLKGRVKSMEALILGVGQDPNLAKFQQAATAAGNMVIQLRTGAAMSEPEAKRILTEMPNLNLPPDTFMARLDKSIQDYNVYLRQRSKLAFGRTTPGDVDRMTSGSGNSPNLAAPGGDDPAAKARALIDARRAGRK